MSFKFNPFTNNLDITSTADELEPDLVAGSDTQVQFNDGGSAFGADSGLTYNKSTDVLSAGGLSLALDKKITLGDTDVHIQSDDDGHLDLTADTSIDMNGIVLATNKISFTQIDNLEYIDSLADGYLDEEATTGIRLRINNVEQVNLIDGIFQPTTSNDIDLGTSSLLFKDIWEIGKHYFRDSAIHISSVDDGHLDLTADTSIDVNGLLNTTGGRICNTTRVTSSPYAVLATDEVILVDTDGGAITVNLPAGVDGTHYKVINCGSSGNNVTLDPNGTEELFNAGAGVATTLYDGEIADIHYETTEGWF